jgi:bla regulator protein blaR1
MIILLKIILCSGILLGIYYLFLAKEKTFTFNRFYLLFGLIFSYIVPFITIEKELPEIKSNLVFETIQQQPDQKMIIPVEESFNYENLLLAVYVVVSAFFLLKFIYSIIKLKKLKGEKIIYKNKTVILLEKDIAPFSFMNRIYFAKSYLKDNKIDDSMFLHEKIHVKQKHSLDIFLVEILKIISWFNPFIYFYKKTISTNHEFLADEQVIHENYNIKSYQELILSEILKQQNMDLIHPFNFNDTKKRFIMMTNKNSKFAQVKKYLSIPVFAGLTLLFAEKVYANNNSEIANNIPEIFSKPISDTKNNSEALQEFIKITEKYKEIIDNKDFERFKTEVPRNEQVKLVELFNKIDIKNRLNLPIWIGYHEINREIPTQKQLSQFLNTKYNITLDGNVVNNTILKNYKNTDFYNVYVLKVFPENPDYGKFDYSVTLYTTEYAKKFNRKKNIALSFKATDNSEYEEYLKRVKAESEKTVTETKKVLDTIRPKEGKNTKINQQALKTDVVSSLEDNYVQAEFPEGINTFRNKVASNFNGKVLTGKEGLLKSVAMINIDEKGEIKQIYVMGENSTFNNEISRTILAANNEAKWKPATRDGKPVPTVFKLPITMNFQ